MSLTARLSTFFLVALALTLSGFALTLYGLAHVYLHRRFEERLQAVQTTLLARVDVEDDGVEWEPREPPRFSGEGLVWTVHDDQGRLLDHSPNLSDDDPLRPAPNEEPPPTDHAGGPRRVLRCSTPEDRTLVVPPGSPPEKVGRVTVTVAAPTEPVTADLRTLATALAGTSLVVWLAAFVAGRWLCRRALRPLRDMTETARVMSARERDRRLPVPATGDELETMGRSFNGLLDRLQEADERQRRFTGDASHQLRTPLTIVLGQVEVCVKPRTPEEYRTTLERVLAQGTNLKQIVEGLLYLARADAEARLDDVEPLDLTAWLPRHLESWSSHPRRADLRLEAPDGAPVWVRAQGPLLGQLLDNLLDNAFKYSEAGSAIALRLAADGAGATLTIEDHGCGIAAEDLPRVFEAFYRGTTGRPGRAGVGLGLAVARRLARLFGGELCACSRPREGTRFELRLPCAQAEKRGEPVFRGGGPPAPPGVRAEPEVRPHGE